jgi:nitrite reductase/ring-hydroxylating ferredoxin subunit/uncharacterized membrane protein
MLNPELVTNRRPTDRLARNSGLAKLAEAIQPVVRGLLERSGSLVQDLLHGTPLGHPLHPPITDIPIGGWTIAAVLDGLECAGRTDVGFAADTAVVVGLLGGLGAIATGWAEWSDTKDEPRTLGLAHAVLNGLGFTGYAGSFFLRRTGNRGAGIAVAFASYGFIGLAAYVGGDLAYGMQLGVRHTAEPLLPPNDFTVVLSEAALPENGAIRADFAGVPVLLSRSEGGVAAISAVCTHRGAPLDEGEFAGGCVRCPWHGSKFRLDGGAVVRGPASFPQPVFEARVHAGNVELRALQEL